MYSTSTTQAGVFCGGQHRWMGQTLRLSPWTDLCPNLKVRTDFFKSTSGNIGTLGICKARHM